MLAKKNYLAKRLIDTGLMNKSVDK